MLRVLAPFTHMCHICGTRFEAYDVCEPCYGAPVLPLPVACPACTAPIKTGQPIDIGAGKDLILTFYGLPEYRRDYGTAQQFLEQLSLLPEDVDTYLAVVEQIDFVAWKQLDARLKARAPLSAADRAETAIIARAHADLLCGTLLGALRDVADRARQNLRQQRAHHLWIYQQRQARAAADL